MSTVSLPSYVAPMLPRAAPDYTVEPQDDELRLALADRLRQRPTGTFVKASRGGDVRLVLDAQDSAALPVYGAAGKVEGRLELAKTEGVTNVELKIEGRLHLREIAEGGTSSIKMSLGTALLWVRDPNASHSICPSFLNFVLNLPPTFTHEEKTYPLPPTFSVKLSGLPGFIATIEYHLSATINKPHAVPPLVPIVKSSLLGISIGTTTITTPFIYYPRTRPAAPIPVPLIPTTEGFVEAPEWRVCESAVVPKVAGVQEIRTRLYLPASRIFCVKQPIPFHLVLQSSAKSLAAFLPCVPYPTLMNTKQATRLQLMRQSTVDVRSGFTSTTKTDMWRVDCIGEGVFRLIADGTTTILFSGEVKIDSSVKVPGFRAAGLSVKDCVLLTVEPPDPHRSPFNHLRQIIPVRLTTDSADGAGVGAIPGIEVAVPTPPSDQDNWRA
ncbi:hypothetical protein AMATHDRAFT_55290 [Amanita thiersii Skay4041]|uniref:Arrestin-like N-terminal domain-containing protein n=1 Tax=Amanita thiersii Skay4041 TaxID=703135 RepID=A0A2A9NZK0_9AGAR|nr:hypothetical protein AMATHDRAFT_55290 [Amanita thiersii Skay4041]